MGRYEGSRIYENAEGYQYKSEVWATLEKQPDGSVGLTISTPSIFFTIKLESLSDDSATIPKQDVQDKRTGSNHLIKDGDLSIQKGVLQCHFINSNNLHSFIFFRAERKPGPLVRADYLGVYSAWPEHNEVLKPYAFEIKAGLAANEVVLKNVRGKGLTVPGRISGDTLYTERVPMDTLGNFLAASKSVLRGNVLYIPFIMQGPGYPLHSASASAAVKCYKN